VFKNSVIICVFCYKFDSSLIVGRVSCLPYMFERGERERENELSMGRGKIIYNVVKNNLY